MIRPKSEIRKVRIRLGDAMGLELNQSINQSIWWFIGCGREAGGREKERERGREERSLACHSLIENTRTGANAGRKNSILEWGPPGVVLSTTGAAHLQRAGLAKETHNHGDYHSLPCPMPCPHPTVWDHIKPGFLYNPWKREQGPSN